MKTDTSDKIIQYIQENQQITVKQLCDYLGFSPQAVHRQLNNLVGKGLLVKIGRPPKVFYQIAVAQKKSGEIVFHQGIREVINQNFYTVTPSGQEMSGEDGFVYWCGKRGLDPYKQAQDYCVLLDQYAQHKQDGLIDGLSKIQSTFQEVFLDALFYCDFYAMERFGKTRLGQILLYAKQSQDKKQIQRLVDYIGPPVYQLIQKQKIDAVGFIPPSVKREVQLMTELQKGLGLLVPHLSIVKVKTPVIVPQKTLSKLDDRLENAAQTIIVSAEKLFRNVLLIDDAAGSGATLNETARQIKNKGIAQRVLGFVITGSIKGFDVISEV